MSNGLDIIHAYLQIALIYHTIGNQIRPTHLELIKLSRKHNDDESFLESSFSPQVLLRLSDLLQRCLDFSRKDLTKLVPAPWSRDSTYAALIQELNTVHIMYGGDSALLDSELLEALQSREGGAGYHVVCVSMLYSIRILLDVVFIPIPIAPAMDSKHCVSDQEENFGRAGNISSPRKFVFFPAAPRSFWCERLAACLRTARAVTSLCRSLMEHYDFAMVSRP